MKNVLKKLGINEESVIKKVKSFMEAKKEVQINNNTILLTCPHKWKQHDDVYGNYYHQCELCLDIR